jgi:signal transduction histidine kinase
LNVVVDGIDAAIRDLRNYIFGLRPGLLADRELEGALRGLADELRLTAGEINR